MFVFLIVILLLAALLEYLSLRGGAACVDANLSLSKNRAEPDETLTLTTTVRNTGRLPLSYLAVRSAFPLSAALPEGADTKCDASLCMLTDVYRLWGRRSVGRTMPFSVGKRGVHTISGRYLIRGDFLGIRTQSERFSARQTLLVYPRRLQSSALLEALGTYCGEMTAQRWLLRDPVLTLGVREYTGSEPMHTISWSQTARRGALTVREFDYTRSLNCCVLLSVNGLESGESELLDRCCGAARTVCDALIAAGVEAALYTNSALVAYRNLPVRSATASLGREKDVLDILARVTAAPCCSVPELAAAAMEVQSDTSAYVLIVPHATDETDAALRTLNQCSPLGALCIAVDALEVD